MPIVSTAKSFNALSWITLLLAISFSACNSHYTSWETDKTVHGIEFERIRYGINEKDTITIIGYLKKDTMINECPCAADWVHFTRDWELKLFRLGADKTINNYPYKTGTWIRIGSDNCVTCVFPGDTFVQGYLCRGGGGVKGISTSFYQSGKLHYFFPPDNIRIGDVYCKCNSLNNIGLYENGNLKECTLAQEKSFNGVIFSSGSRIFFDENGNVKTKL